ncbi:unnamed protein product [Prorocentrum cordatum]|uniref:Uncharacterized protein n=1 Tax=Prorocentrum cordatum TaxID=2364126 RepID=A0ABN9U4M3_9DINO|nr:unnamed protein product [Polarella glacialis]
MAGTDDGQSLSWARPQLENELLEESMPQPGQLLLFLVRDDEGEPQGHALARVESLGPLDSEGAEIDLTVISASDGYYWWWIGAQASPAKHHLCRGASESCLGGSMEHELIHIDEFRVMERRQAQVLHTRWIGRSPDLPPVLASPLSQVIIPVWLMKTMGRAISRGARSSLLGPSVMATEMGCLNGGGAAYEVLAVAVVAGLPFCRDDLRSGTELEEGSSPDDAEPDDSKALVKVLARALRKVSTSSSGDDDVLFESDDGAGGSSALPSSWSGKRTVLKRPVRTLPGKISERECEYTLEHLDEDDVNFDNRSVPKAVVLKFLQRLFMKDKTATGVGEGRYREMRTIATSLDLLMSGKALEEVKKGNTLVSKWFELLPVDLDGSSLSAHDEEFATTVAEGETKMKAFLGKIGRVQGRPLALPPGAPLALLDAAARARDRGASTRTKATNPNATGTVELSPEDGAPAGLFALAKAPVAPRAGEAAQTTVCDIGLSLLVGSREFPGRLGKFFREFEPCRTPSEAGARTSRNILQFPSYYPAQFLGKVERLRAVGAPIPHEYTEAGRIYLATMKLSYLQCGALDASAWAHPAKSTLGQAVAIDSITAATTWFLGQSASEGRFVAPRQLLDFCDEDAREWLRRRELCCLPEYQWPSDPPRAQVHVVSDPEHFQIVRFLFDIGVAKLIDESDIFHHRGRMFGVPKSGSAPDGPSTALRPIINLGTIRSYLRQIYRNAGTLPAAPQWAKTALDEGENI